MTDLPPALVALGDALADLPTDSEAMVLSQLDGYVAGLLVSPARLLVDEWLPEVWGEADAEADPDADRGLALFGDADRLAEVTALVVQHYDSVGDQLADFPDDYAPIYDVAGPEPGEDAAADEEEELVWEGWVIGFQSALALQRDAWEAVLEAPEDDPAREALEVMLELYAIAVGESDLEPEALETMRAQAPDLIPALVVSLWDAGETHPGAGPRRSREPVRVTKVGRNDPCPCGSGKKYKKCCGAEG